MRRTALGMVVLALVGCGGGGGGSTAPTVPAGPSVEDLEALASAEARAAFEAGAVAAGDPVARLEVAAAGVDAVARSGAPGSATVGHVPGSSLPCGPGLAVFLGGARSSFAALSAVAVGDRVEVLTPVGLCTYDVSQSAAVAAADLDLTGGGARRPGSIVLATPAPAGDDLRQVVVGQLVEGSVVTVPDPAGTTTTTEPVVAVPRPSGREAVLALLDAWRAGDRRAALVVAAPTAVDAMFAVPVEATQDRGCTQGSANPTVSCVFRLPGGELQVRAAPAGGGFLVDQVIFAAH